MYDDVHIGNIAPVIVFDFLIRCLKSQNINYIYVHNITDIDDKIINRAQELRITEKEISSKYEQRYLDILKRLNIISPSILPRVSDHIDDIQKVIQSLINKGYAHKEGEDVVFSVDKVNEYGELSKQKLQELKSTSNFCLWKKTTVGKTWSSPWGEGRPGWHTECFAFIDKYLSGTVHIHGGGIDLKFPHHENENAHCRALHNSPLAHIWIHVGHLSTESGKISKSDNKKYLVKDLLKIYSPNLIRLLFLTNNYSFPSLVTDEKLEELNKELGDFQLTINRAVSKIYLSSGKTPEYSSDQLDPQILQHLSNDLNLPQVLTRLHHIRKSLLTAIKQNLQEDIQTFHRLLSSSLTWLGFQITHTHSPEQLKSLTLWKELIEKKSWKEADEIRNELMQAKLI